MHSRGATAHAALEAAEDNIPLSTEIPVAHAVAVPASHDAPHKHRILGLPQLPPTSTRQVLLEPLLLGAVQREADQLGSACRNVVAAPVQDRGYQLLEEELSGLLGVCSGEVKGLGETRPRQGAEQQGQGLGPAKDRLNGVVVGEGEGVVAILGILDECCDYVVGELGSQGGVCEILERML